jgi:hypothetical protein
MKYYKIPCYSSEIVLSLDKRARFSSGGGTSESRFGSYHKDQPSLTKAQKRSLVISACIFRFGSPFIVVITWLYRLGSTEPMYPLNNCRNILVLQFRHPPISVRGSVYSVATPSDNGNSSHQLNLQRFGV